MTVTEDEIAEAVRNLYTDTHNIAEGAGASPLAALSKERGKYAGGKRAGLILSGGNIDMLMFAQILQGQTPVI